MQGIKEGFKAWGRKLQMFNDRHRIVSLCKRFQRLDNRSEEQAVLASSLAALTLKFFKDYTSKEITDDN